MSPYRIATYNVEWMQALFDDAGKLLFDDEWSARYKVTRAAQIEALGKVFTALDADAVMVIEAPDSHRRRDGVAALETFAEWAGLRARKALMGFVNHTRQEIALLYDPDRLTARHDPMEDAANAPRFDGVFEIDLDVEGRPDPVRWSKPPFELAMETAEGFAFRMIGVHAKSKAPHGASTPKDIMRVAIENRRKQLAQCIWLRRRVDAELAAGNPLIVLGDLNDGPGLDEYERLFSRSGVEIVMGENGEIPLHDPHAALSRTQPGGDAPATARFWLAEEKRYMETLLDYVMVSPDLKARAQGWRIWHPDRDPAAQALPELQSALLTASDHFPVSLDIDLATETHR